jgi:PEP-CTERM motif
MIPALPTYWNRTAMNIETTPTKPLPRTLSVLLVLVVLTAFLPHRERALMLTEGGLDTLLTSDSLASNSFFAPAPFGYYKGVRLNWWPAGGEPDGLRRARNAPDRTQYSQLLPTTLPTLPGSSAGPPFIPLGTSIPGAAPALSSPAPSPGSGASSPGSPRSGPGAIGSLPGGGGGGGGGSISGPTNPVVPTQPPVGAIPEPASWALMILGFGVIGSGLRRSRKLMRAANSPQSLR